MTLYLVRHASAGPRSGRLGDVERPLDDKGRAQAQAIAQWFGERGIDSIYSSPARRCVETVEPLATLRAMSVEIRDELIEGTNGATLAATLGRLALAGVDAVLCSHGDLIPAALDELAHGGIPLAGNGCKKGSIWILHTSNGQITEGRYQAAPL